MALNPGKSDPKSKARHPKLEKMTLRLAQRFGIDEGAQTYEELPAGVRALYSHFSYQEIARPLICMDKKESPNLSCEALSNRYGVPRITVYRILLNWIGRDAFQ